MESTTVISLSDKVLSRCQLLNTEMTLLDTPVGLCLKWFSDEKETKSKKLYSAVVTKTKTPGQLYPVQLNAELELAIFGKRYKSNSEDFSESCVATIVVCDTGTVVAAHYQQPGTLVILCHHSEATVWAGIIKDNGVCAVVVVSRGGIIHIGLKSRVSRLQWHKETLKVSPVVCHGHNNLLFISDGTTSWLCFINLATNDKVEHKCYKLSYYGIIRVRGVDKDSLELFTCDGRTYRCEWKHLVESVKSEKSLNTKAKEKEELSCTIEEVMTGIRRCSELMQVEGNLVHDLNVYLNQLSLATSLLVEPQKHIFSATVKVEHRLEQSNSYIAVLNLKKNVTGVDLEGKWWKLNVIVPGPDGKQTLCVKLDDQNFNQDVCIFVPLPNLDLTYSLASIRIMCYLILDHYTTFHPVCQIFACQADVDVFHFLTHKHILNNTKISPTNFMSAIQSIAIKKHSDKSNSRTDFSPLPFCQVTLSFIANDKNTQLFVALMNQNSLAAADAITDKSMNQVQLWYHDTPIDIHYLLCNERMDVTVSGPIPSLVLSAKSAIERRIIEHGSGPSCVTLPSEVFRQAQRSCQILEFESSKTTTPAALSHLHQTTTKMLSHLPV